MNKDTSPEEKLLKLIKAKGSTEDPAGEENLLSEPSVDENIYRKEETHDLSLDKIHRVNVIFRVIIGLLLCVFLLQTASHWLRMNRFKYGITDRKTYSKPVTDAPSAIPLGKLIKQFQGRQLFKVFFVTEQQTKKTGQTKSIQDLIKHVELAGIIMEEEPTAILYDKKTRQNTYLHEGDSFNEMEVLTIKNNSVTFVHGDEEIELSL